MSVSPATLQAWENKTGTGPDSARPAFDWTKAMSSEWNQELVIVLSDAFLREVKDSEHLPLTEAMCPPVKAIYTNLTKKMQKVQTAYNKFEGKPPIEFELAKTKSAAEGRRNVRRAGVCLAFSRLATYSMTSLGFESA